MVDYKVRTFFEPDSDTVGAEVKIYSTAGDEIDAIFITTQENWRRLYEKLDNLDETYLDKEELLTILSNIGETAVNINATTLDGLSSDAYAKANHNELHTNYFAPIAHDSSLTKYGLGSTDKYGHVKTVNNLNTNSHVSGEALSAYQGKVLNDLVTALQKVLDNKPSEVFKQGSALSTDRFTSNSFVRFRKWGKLVTVDVWAVCNSQQSAKVLRHICGIPDGYNPTDTVHQSFYNNSSGDALGGVVSVVPNEGVKFWLPKKFTPVINCNLTYLID